jgi:hypothetical protein
VVDEISPSEKCVKYINPARERIENNNDGYKLYVYIGTYYSKSKSACVTKYTESNLSPKEKRTNYYNEFTGEEMVSYPDGFEKSIKEFEEGLDLVR